MPEGTQLATRLNRRRRDRVYEKTAAVLKEARSGRLQSGSIRDYDEENVCVQADAAPAAGERVFVRFQLPRNMWRPYGGLACAMPGVVRQVRRSDAGFDVVVRWDRPLSQLVAAAVAAHNLKIGSVMLAVLAAMVYLKWNSLQFFWYTPVLYSYSFLIGGYFLSRFAVSAFHRAPEPTGYEPTVSVCISVRNEQDVIARTIETIFAADYPEDKKEVVVVNDGSTDGTAKVVSGLLGKYPRLKLYTIPPSGKRHGMATGVYNSSGEIVVFVDSDTFMWPDALRRIVCGFEDRTLGAAAGHTEVDNGGLNALTGLQEVRYYLSFKMMKAAESVFGAVTCCPGCLSAYRREYLVRVLPAWLNQRFLGAQATFGDDRSLTNYILRDYRVIYNDTAIASTLVPETWRRYMTQQVRWKKSWLRETLIAGRFMWKKHPLAVLSFYISAVCSLLSPLMVFRAVFWEVSKADSIFMYYMVGLILIGLLQCFYFLMKRPNGRWLLGMLMVASQILLMGPQTYYAMFTMRRNHWGTR